MKNRKKDTRWMALLAMLVAVELSWWPRASA